MINLAKQEFLEEVRHGRIPPLCREVPYVDPILFYRSIHDRKNTIFLDSAKGSMKIAQYSFIAANPYLIFRLKDGEVEIEDTSTGRKTLSFRKPFERLNELLGGYPQKMIPGLPPFQGGAVGLLSYDFARYIEQLPTYARDDLQIPDVHFLFFETVYAFDHLLRQAWIICAPGARFAGLGYGEISNIDWAQAYDDSLEAISRGGMLYPQKVGNIQKSMNGALPVTYEMSKNQYMAMVRRAKAYIAAGDIFQANLSQRIFAEVGGEDPWPIYEVLREVNPSPFAAYADFGDYQIVSSSPERLIEVKGHVVETRPIAGTRPRGKDRDEDFLMRSELLLNEKERAEHIMLIDLERNDIGRVSRYGSVIVDELMITEDYSHVIHIVSNVRGLINEGMTCLDVVRASFPGGTITGVPKVRCMEIIDELEPVRRGPYTGSLGYIGFSGNMDLNIIIRTFVIKQGRAYIQAGAGIVADSDPEREYFETLKKAEALVNTLNKLAKKRV